MLPSPFFRCGNTRRHRGQFPSLATTMTSSIPTAFLLRHAMCLLIIAANYTARSRQASAASPGYGGGDDCPPSYWDEPSKRCSDSLHAVLDEIRTSDLLISAEMRLNKTCREWDRTNACYQQLIQKCHSDANALHELRIHIGRYVIYSLPCQDPSLRYRKNMADCFLPDIKSTRACNEAIDRYLRRFVENKDYRSACRIISTAMRCFHDIKNNIKQRCRQEGADEYQLNYIRPLVEQTRSTVLTQCSLSSPYKEYFNSAAVSAIASSQSGRHRHRGWTSRTVTAVMWSIVVFLIVHLFIVGPTSATVSGWTEMDAWYRRPIESVVCRPGLWCAFSDSVGGVTASVGRAEWSGVSSWRWDRDSSHPRR